MPLIFDCIHGYVDFSKDDLPFLDNRWMKRLKRIKQLGLLDHVFPSGSHSRFEHSIGVYHLADKYIKLLESHTSEKLFTIREKRCIKLAGLFHDLGHGPYSHVFDSTLNTVENSSYHKNMKMGELLTNHEHRSCLIVKQMMEEIMPKDLDKDDVNLIIDIINPPKDMIIIDSNGFKKYKHEKPYLFQIINNKINSIDVDKLDYLQRDARHIGLDYAFDPERILKKSFVDVNSKSLIYDISTKNNIYDLFYTRYRMHKDIYNHITVKMCEFMLKDAIKSLICDYDDIFNIYRSCLINVKNNSKSISTQFLLLDDSLYNKILNWKTLSQYSEYPSQLINRIESRKLYKCVYIYVSQDRNQCILNKNNKLSELKLLDKNEVYNYIILSFNFCSGDIDPLTNVLFHDKYSDKIDVGSSKNRLVTNQFQEYYLIVYKLNT